MDKIRNYLLDEKKMTPVVANRIIGKFERHPDISKEFVLWIDTGSYDVSTPVIVEGYSAGDIAKLAPFMDGVGVYNFLISLREQPEKAKQHIVEGFPRK